MNDKEELQEKIKEIQKKIDGCSNDAIAILLQKQLIDLLRVAFKNKEFLADFLSQNKK